MFKDKILAAIKAKFPHVNLSKKRLEAIAAKIEAKVIDDETKIDAALDVFNEYNPLVEMAKQDDTLRDLNSKVKAAPAKKDEPAKVEPVVVDDDTPAWAKALIDQNKTLAADLAVIKGEKALSSIKAKATEKLKDVPTSYWGKRALPEKEEDLEAFVTEVQTDYTGFTKELTEKGLSIVGAPRTSAGPAVAGSKEVSPEIKGFVAATQAKAAAAVSK